MRRDSSAVGLKAKLKITTTSSAKNSMELIASLERHSMRRSLSSVVRVTLRWSSRRPLRIRDRRFAEPLFASHDLSGSHVHEFVGHTLHECSLMRNLSLIHISEPTR